MPIMSLFAANAVKRAKTKASTTITSCRRLSFLLRVAEASFQRVWWFSHVHVRTTDFVSRGFPCGEPAPVSIQFE